MSVFNGSTPAVPSGGGGGGGGHPARSGSQSQHSAAMTHLQQALQRLAEVSADADPSSPDATETATSLDAEGRASDDRFDLYVTHILTPLIERVNDRKTSTHFKFLEAHSEILVRNWNPPPPPPPRPIALPAALSHPQTQLHHHQHQHQQQMLGSAPGTAHHPNRAPSPNSPMGGAGSGGGGAHTTQTQFGRTTSGLDSLNTTQLNSPAGGAQSLGVAGGAAGAGGGGGGVSQRAITNTHTQSTYSPLMNGANAPPASVSGAAPPPPLNSSNGAGTAHSTGHHPAPSTVSASGATFTPSHRNSSGWTPTTQAAPPPLPSLDLKSLLPPAPAAPIRGPLAAAATPQSPLTSGDDDEEEAGAQFPYKFGGGANKSAPAKNSGCLVIEISTESSDIRQLDLCALIPLAPLSFGSLTQLPVPISTPQQRNNHSHQHNTHHNQNHHHMTNGSGGGGGGGAGMTGASGGGTVSTVGTTQNKPPSAVQGVLNSGQPHQPQPSPPQQHRSRSNSNSCTHTTSTHTTTTTQHQGSSQHSFKSAAAAAAAAAAARAEQWLVTIDLLAVSHAAVAIRRDEDAAAAAAQAQASLGAAPQSQSNPTATPATGASGSAPTPGVGVGAVATTETSELGSTSGYATPLFQPLLQQQQQMLHSLQSNSASTGAGGGASHAPPPLLQPIVSAAAQANHSAALNSVHASSGGAGVGGSGSGMLQAPNNRLPLLNPLLGVTSPVANTGPRMRL